MDYPPELAVIELCAGYAGLSLGIELAGVPARPVVYVEREAFAAANLVQKMEAQRNDQKTLLVPAPVWPDIKTFNGRPFRGVVDGILAGFPCQPWSVAGGRQGISDSRWLWPDIDRIVREVEPGIVFLENVPGLLAGGVEHVLGDLAEMGFDAEWGCFSAAEAGAPHKRERVFILGYRNGEWFNLAWNGRMEREVLHQTQREEGEHLPCSSNAMDDSAGNRGDVGRVSARQGRTGRRAADPARAGDDVSHPGGEGLQGNEFGNSCGHSAGARASGSVAEFSCLWPAPYGCEQYEWEPPRTVIPNAKSITRREREREIRRYGGKLDNESWRPAQPPLGGNPDGGTYRLDEPDDIRTSITNRIDELRLCGNGVVPQQVAMAWRELWSRI